MMKSIIKYQRESMYSEMISFSFRFSSNSFFLSPYDINNCFWYSLKIVLVRFSNSSYRELLSFLMNLKLSFRAVHRLLKDFVVAALKFLYSAPLNSFSHLFMFLCFMVLPVEDSCSPFNTDEHLLFLEPDVRNFKIYELFFRGKKNFSPLLTGTLSFSELLWLYLIPSRPA